MALITYDNLLEVSPADLKQSRFEDCVRPVVAGENISIAVRPYFFQTDMNVIGSGQGRTRNLLVESGSLEQAQAANN